jgi:hypothetical protein
MTSRVQTLSAHFTAAAAAAAAAAAPAEEQVLYQVHDGVGVITLNRPSRGNAYTPKMQLGYAAALKRANADNAVLAIVVTGAGKMFCVGADKDWLSGALRARVSARELITSPPRPRVGSGDAGRRLEGSCPGAGIGTEQGGCSKPRVD